MKKILVLLIASLLLSGCYTTKISNPSIKPGSEISQWRYHGFFGLVQYQDDALAQCPNGEIAYVESSFTFANILVDTAVLVVTAGLSPLFFNTSTLKMACSY